MDYPYQMMYNKTPVNVQDIWGIHARSWIKQLLMAETNSTTHTRWYTKQLTMDETDEGIHTRWCTRQLLMGKTNEGLPIPDHVQNACSWTRKMKNPYQIMYETTADGWNQWRTAYTRWYTKQLLMDDKDEGIHNRWCTKQLLMDEVNEILPIPDDIQNNCWWMREMKESIPDEARNNSWWMRRMKDYPCQMMYKTTVDGRCTWRNAYR